MTSLLEVSGLSASYGPIAVLHDVDLFVKEGGITAVLGANGAGKTTLLRSICNMGPQTRGEIRFAGRRIDTKSTESIVGLGLAHVPDGRGTFVELTVEENLRLGAYLRRDKNVEADTKRIYSYFPRLLERRRQQAGLLSGGEQQMLAISRALLLRPRLLVLDEPSFGLAPLVVADIFKILSEINRTHGVGMLLVEQNASLAFAIADTACVLENGRVSINGPSATVKNDQAVRHAYLGT